MNRRQFLKMSAGAAAISAFGGCVHHSGSATIGLGVDAGVITVQEFHATRQFAKLDQGSIAFVERGKGKAALFLHGFPLNGFQWRGVLNPLSAFRRCIALDFMGLGYTEVNEGKSVTPSAQVAMIAAFLDSLSIGTVDLLANDSGGGVAQLFMARHPKRVRTLLLTNCDVEPDSPPPSFKPIISLAREGTLPELLLAPWLEDKELARSAKQMGGVTYTDPNNFTDEVIECYLRPLLRSARRKELVNAYALGLDPNPLAGIESALKRCNVPTRIVWGTGDTIFSQSSPDYLVSILPKSRGIRRVQSAKLFFPEEYPELISTEARTLWGP